MFIKGAPQVPVQVLVVPSTRVVIRGFPTTLQARSRVLLSILLNQEVLLSHLVPLPEVDGVLSSR
jgi:hypothetical protein